MPDSFNDTKNSLDKVWNTVWDFWEPDNSWNNDQGKCIEIQNKLACFNEEHPNDPTHIDSVVKAVQRGVALVQAAIEWQEPSIGKNKPRKLSEKLRGHQWRLVITYSGFEITVKALMNHQQRGIDIKVIEKFLRKCDIPEYKHLSEPRKTSSIKKWLSKEDGKLAEFLGISNGDRRIIEKWIVESQPINSWDEAIKLAKAIRNASAHGFLTATKVEEWKLKPALCKLTHDLASIVAYGLQKLT
ncbi:hypothetical protein [Microcoleus sp. FACHB-672]|uniref:hypothetical protein n=1 Tax=Microcoleus sp. FACHB-672 TaxID=2692825 RepID=UPI001682B908|nr:hypothetical protein [Microcoleus sp. FACHB-672]MBD2043342.1 hypothetical protein [Microcoleus sp. FACHB-672]